MKRFLSIFTAFAILLSVTTGFSVHVHAETNTDETVADEAGTETFFEETLDAIPFVRGMLQQRITNFIIKLPIETYSSDVLERLYSSAVTYTVTPGTGDCLLWQCIPTDCYAKIDAGYVYLHYSFVYLTTAQEEEELDGAVDTLLAELQCDTGDDYASVKKVYDWVCANVAYVSDENASLHDFSAYGALINRKATSQGFALLLYQLFHKLGIRCRIVAGTSYGQDHLWNVVLIRNASEKYYYLDAAWDAGKTEYAWFLKGSERFSDHLNAQEYDPENFDPVKKVAKEDYALQEEPEHRHDWTPVSCTEPKTCTVCGLTTGEYKAHDFGWEVITCERARFCYVCQQVIPPQPHTYNDMMDTVCDICGHERLALCVGDSCIYTLTSLESTEVPQFSDVPGLTATLLDDFVDKEGVHSWTYEFHFTEAGSYRISVQYGDIQKTEMVDALVSEHVYNIYSGRCNYCDKMNEEQHIHNWQYATCYEPMICTDCGQTHGEPLEHDFRTWHCTREPAVCHMCGLIKEGPQKHLYTFEGALQCAICGTERIKGCTEGGALYRMPGEDPDEFRLVDTDPGVSASLKRQYVDGTTHFCEFELKSGVAGQHEVTFENTKTGSKYEFTFDAQPHALIAGKCVMCGMSDPAVHFHKWEDATCDSPKTCIECGETSGFALGHAVEDGPCTEAKTCIRCGTVVEAPSHYYRDLDGNACVYCDRLLYPVCYGTGLNMLLSSSERGDFLLEDGDAGFSLSLMEFFVVNGLSYWEYVIYTPGPGIYEIDLTQKGSEESLGITIQVVSHIFVSGSCMICGTLEEGENIHNWKSATCQKSAVCSECGETEGTPLNHDYSGYACSEYARCDRCGENRGKVPHTYDDKWDDHCNICNQLRIVFCGDGGSRQIILYNRNTDGFYLKNAPSGVSMEKRYYPNVEVDGYYQHVYSLDAGRPAPGTYEAVFADTGGKDSLPFTLQIYRHEYVDGDCVNCGKSDPDIHFHTWEYATCLKPKYCKTCGETEGEATGHDWVEATCMNKKYCSDCRMTEGEILPHDFVEWSCTEPGVCRYCNTLQDHPAGHTYDDDLDEFCNRCDQFRLIGCQDQVLEIRFTSALDTPYTLFNPEKGVSMILEGCVWEGDQYIHTYRISVPGVGAYELTAVQGGNPEQEIFTVQVFDHQYADGFCGSCGVEMAGLPGDVDGNGRLSYNDALLVLRASISLEEFTEAQEALGDFDCNGRLTYNDALLILRASIGLEVPQ